MAATQLLETPLIETKGLTMRFGGVTAVNTVDFSLKPGELRCLIGPNGAGKSTFFKMLTGQLVPSSGTVAFKGTNVAGAKSHDIARLGIGIKTQTPSLFNGLSVHENLWLAARRRNTAKRANALVDEVLERTNMTSRARNLVGILAHGQRQWVEIGTVLAGEPDLILLDEPAAGMTHDDVIRTAGIIRDISRTNALVVVEHDMQFIRMIGDVVTVFHQGSVLIEDKVDVVLRDQRVRDVYLGKKAAA
jgi:branched-chain amino acid transport system ATP-binding protein